MSNNRKDEKQRKALQIYVDTNGNASEVARSVGVSRVTINEWKKKGLPHSMTQGKTWDEYLELVNTTELQKFKANAIQSEFDFLDVARQTLQETLLEMRAKLKMGQFEAKPGDLPKLIEMFAKLDARDADMKNWMNGIIVKIMTIIAEVVDSSQYAVIGTKLLDMNREETEKLHLIQDPGLPQLPGREEVRTDYSEAEMPITDALDTDFTVVS